MRESNRLYYPPSVGENRVKTFGYGLVWAAVFWLLCALLFALCAGGK